MLPQYMHPEMRVHTHTHKGGFMEASGDMLWTGFGRFTDMCGLKLEQLENAFHPSVHPSIPEHTLLPSCLLHLIL